MEPDRVVSVFPRSRPILARTGRYNDLNNQRELNSHLFDYVRNPIPNPPKNRQGFFHIARQPYTDVDGIYSGVRIQPPPKFPGFGQGSKFDRAMHPGDIPRYKLVPTMYSSW